MTNEIFNEDCLTGMDRLSNDSIDMCLTSPPYDNLRSYNNSLEWNFEIFQGIAKQLYRVTKPGGVVVWVVNDATVKGSETGTSFKQALYFIECGFNLHDTMIYKKNAIRVYDPANMRYKSGFEFMFVLSKGRVKTYNPIKDVLSKKTNSKGVTQRKPNGGMRPAVNVTFSEYQDRSNIWGYNTGFMSSTKDKMAFQHPAIFPEKLAQDHITSWSNEGDIILDPFAGSGTTLKMAKVNNRSFIGFEKEETYFNLCNERIKNI